MYVLMYRGQPTYPLAISSDVDALKKTANEHSSTPLEWKDSSDSNVFFGYKKEADFGVYLIENVPFISPTSVYKNS